MYGQMTAGSYCYIGPQVKLLQMIVWLILPSLQGIVHGTTLTVLNAGRNQLGTSDLAGKVTVADHYNYTTFAPSSAPAPAVPTTLTLVAIAAPVPPIARCL